MTDAQGPQVVLASNNAKKLAEQGKQQGYNVTVK